MYPDTIKVVVQCTTIGDDHNWSESPRSVPNEEDVIASRSGYINEIQFESDESDGI